MKFSSEESELEKVSFKYFGKDNIDLSPTSPINIPGHIPYVCIVVVVYNVVKTLSGPQTDLQNQDVTLKSFLENIYLCA